VESFFTKLARRRLKRGVFQSIKDLKAATTVSSPKPRQTRTLLDRRSSPL
jgi:hypothetical protein